MNSKKLLELTQYIEAADLAMQRAREILIDLGGGDKVSERIAKNKARGLVAADDQNFSTEQVVEGVFNGQNMVGPDGKEYSVPANYASKSKLVEGDILKLTIQADGSFLYKQINPVERKRVKGELMMDEVTGEFRALGDDGKKYNVLTASVTYFKGQSGDTVTVLVAKDKPCQWAAIENIITNKPETALVENMQPAIKEKVKKEKSGRKKKVINETPILPEIDELKNELANKLNQDDLNAEDLKSETIEERKKTEQMMGEDNLGSSLEIEDLGKL